MLQINGISQGSKKFQQSDIKGFRVKAYIQAASAHSIDLSKLLVDLTLTRGGVSEPVYGNDFLGVVIGANFLSSNYKHILGGNPAIAVATGKVCVSFDIPFETVYNLRNSDELLLEVNVLDGFYKGTTLVASSCQIEIEEIPGIGLEWGTPFFKTLVIPTNESKFTRHLGDNITEIILIDKDNLTAPDEADIAVQMVKLRSDKYNNEMDVIDLKTGIKEHFAVQDEITARGNSQLIYKGETDLDDVKIEINLDPAKVTASRLVLYYRTRYEDANIINMALSRKDNHNARNIQKLRG